MNVDVRIGRIVLDGVELRPRERAALPGAVQRELRILLDQTHARRDTGRSPGREPDGSTGAARVDLIARQVASAVHRGLSAGGAQPALDRPATAMQAGRSR